jgi:hypothetical protein
VLVEVVDLLVEGALRRGSVDLSQTRHRTNQRLRHADMVIVARKCSASVGSAAKWRCR